MARLPDKPWPIKLGEDVRAAVFFPARRIARPQTRRERFFHYAHAELVKGWTRGRPWGRIFPASIPLDRELERRVAVAHCQQGGCRRAA
jgi:hypothetical protein